MEGRWANRAGGAETGKRDVSGAKGGWNADGLEEIGFP